VLGDHPIRSRLAEVLVHRDGKPFRGSGYLVTPGWVLTAAHVIKGAEKIAVWFGAPVELVPQAGIGVDPARVLAVRAADFALLPIGSGHDSAAPLAWGRLDRGNAVPVPVVAAGFPWFKLRAAPGRPEVEIRELEYATGQVQAASNRKTGTYEFAVLGTVPESRGPEESPWEGMSGSAVWASGRLIGVIGQHHSQEGLATLTVRPVEGLFDPAVADGLGEWRQALGSLPETAAELWLASPPTERQLTVERAMGAARPLAPPVLVARQAELDELARLVTSPAGRDRWLWIQADAFAGKTALLAYFALHPPDLVDVAACFLRRTTGDDSPDYALDFLVRQFAAIAARTYQPVGRNIAEFQDMLAEAARACREQGRHLAVVVDGLDEYKTAYAGLDLGSWLPGADTLPDATHLIAASRSGAEVQLDDGHPLQDHQYLLTRSDAAAQIESRAQQEIRQVTLDDPAALSVLAIFAAAETGLSLTEVTTLMQMRPDTHAIDVASVSRLLDTAFGRTFARQDPAEQPGNPVFAFAHETLLDAAREHKYVARVLPECQRLLDKWADDYAKRGWPTETPGYLLLPYTDQLIRRLTDRATEPQICRRLADQLYQTVSHQDRSPRIAAESGNPALADREIATVQRVLLDTHERTGIEAGILLYRLAVLAFRRRPLDGERAEVARSVAGVWVTCGRADAALTLANQILDPLQRNYALGDIAKWHCDAGRPEEALAVAQYMNRDDRFGGVLRKISEAFAAAGLPDRGLAIAEQLKPGFDRAFALTDIAKGYGAAGRGEDALAVAQRVRSEALKLDDSWATNQLVTGISCSLAVAAPVQAMAMVREITDASDRAEAIVEVAGALAQAADPDHALTAVEEALAIAGHVADLSQRASTLGQVANALGEAGYAEQALTAAKEGVATGQSIPDASERAQALAELAEALDRAGHLQQARHAAQEALTDAPHIADPGARTGALANIARVLCDVDERELARTVAADIVQAARQVGDLAQRAECLTEAARTMVPGKDPSLGVGVAREACAVALKIEDPESRAEALSGVGVPLMWAGENEDLLGVVQSEFDAAKNIKSAVLRLSAYVSPTIHLAAVQPTERAIETAERLQEPDARARALSEIAVKLADAGSPQRACEVTRKIDDHNQRASTLAKIAVVAAQDGDCVQALDVAEQAFAAAQYGQQDRVRVLSDVAEKLARTGHPQAASKLIEGALAAVEQAPELEVQLGHLAHVARAAALAGHSVQAFSTAQRIEDPLLRARAFADVARALADAGHTGEALAATRHELAAVQAMYEDNGSRLDETLATLAEQLVALLRPKQALRAARQFESYAQRLNAETYITVAVAEAGDFDTALTLAKRIPHRAWQADAMRRIAEAMIPAGSLSQASDAAGKALTTARKIRNRTDRAEGLAYVAGTLIKAGDIDRALIAARLIDDAAGRVMALARVADVMSDATSAQAASRIVADWGSEARKGLEPKEMDIDVVRALAGRRMTGIARIADAMSTTSAEAARRIISEAIAGTTKMEDPDEHDQAMGLIATALAGVGDFEQALLIGREIADAVWQARAMLAIALSMASTGIPERAFEICQDGMRVWAGIDDADKRNKHSWDVGEAVDRIVGQLADDGYIDQPLALALQIDDEYWLMMAMLSIGSELAKSGNYIRALEIAAQIENDPRWYQHWRQLIAYHLIEAVAKTLSEEGQLEIARTIISQLVKDPEDRASRFTSLSSHLMEAGQPRDALDIAERALSCATEIDDPDKQASSLRDIWKLLEEAEFAPGSDVAERSFQIQLKVQGLLLINPNLLDALRLLPVDVLHRLVADGLFV
jgi:tetratricopeptide (TPR) repeat protein